MKAPITIPIVSMGATDFINKYGTDPTIGCPVYWCPEMYFNKLFDVPNCAFWPRPTPYVKITVTGHLSAPKATFTISQGEIPTKSLWDYIIKAKRAMWR